MYIVIIISKHGGGTDSFILRFYSKCALGGGNGKAFVRRAWYKNVKSVFHKIDPKREQCSSDMR